MEKKGKTRKRMTRDQSTLVCQVFAENKGEWEKVMLDERIKRLGNSKEYLRTHINNKKKKIRGATYAPSKHKSSSEEEEEEHSSDVEEEGSPHKRKRGPPLDWEETESFSDDVSMSLRELNERQESLETRVTEIQASLNEILMLLKK